MLWLHGCLQISFQSDLCPMQIVVDQLHICSLKHSPLPRFFFEDCVVKEMSTKLELEICDGTRIEFHHAHDGMYVRTPDDAPRPVNWHGPYPDRQSARADCLNRRARPVLTSAELKKKQEHGYYSVVDGTPMVLHQSRWSGATILTPFVLADAP